MILHIVKRDEWEDAIRKKEYAPVSLASEGFIHCSTGRRWWRPPTSSTAGRAIW